MQPELNKIIRENKNAIKEFRFGEFSVRPDGKKNPKLNKMETEKERWEDG